MFSIGQRVLWKSKHHSLEEALSAADLSYGTVTGYNRLTNRYIVDWDGYGPCEYGANNLVAIGDVVEPTEDDLKELV